MIIEPAGARFGFAQHSLFSGMIAFSNFDS
jgi:hypothetical protein